MQDAALDRRRVLSIYRQLLRLCSPRPPHPTKNARAALNADTRKDPQKSNPSSAPAATSSSLAEQRRTEIREIFRARRHETSPGQIAAFLQEAASRLGYLKIVTPRSQSGPPRSSTTSADGTSSSSTGRTRYVMIDGRLQEIRESDGAVVGGAEGNSGVRVRDGTPGHVDPDALRKHHALMDRFRFRGPRWQSKS